MSKKWQPQKPSALIRDPKEDQIADCHQARLASADFGNFSRFFKGFFLGFLASWLLAFVLLESGLFWAFGLWLFGFLAFGFWLFGFFAFWLFGFLFFLLFGFLALLFVAFVALAFRILSITSNTKASLLDF